jgi:hypothetical protein
MALALAVGLPERHFLAAKRLLIGCPTGQVRSEIIMALNISGDQQTVYYTTST